MPTADPGKDSLFSLMHLKLIGCEMFENDVRAAAARSHNQIDFEFLPANSHQLSHLELVRALQTKIDRNDRSRFHAVLLLAGSCKQGLSGLEARSIPLVLPRARDCISLVIEQSVSLDRPGPIPGSPGPGRTFREHSGRGQGSLRSHPSHWMVPVHESAPRANLAGSPGHHLYSVQGRRSFAGGPPVGGSLLRRLVDGYWNYQEFLVAAPGWRLTVDEKTGGLRAEEVA